MHVRPPDESLNFFFEPTRIRLGLGCLGIAHVCEARAAMQGGHWLGCGAMARLHAPPPSPTIWAFEKGLLPSHLSPGLPTP
jgi:hypothetical protein